MSRSFALTAALIMLVAGCSNPVPLGAQMPSAYPIKTPPPILSGIINATPSPGASGQSLQDEIKANLANPPKLSPPLKLGVLFLGFEPAMKPEDQQTVIAGLTASLQSSGLVQALTMIPPSLTSGSDSLENMRRIASRFGANTLLIVTGATNLAQADDQSRGFADNFSNRTNYVARTELTALPVDVVSGRLLLPIEVVGKAGPQWLNPGESSFSAASYTLKKDAETQALQQLQAQLVAVAKTGGSTP